jgi:hypothetical protein
MEIYPVLGDTGNAIRRENISKSTTELVTQPMLAHVYQPVATNI